MIHKVRIMNGFSFEEQSREKKGELNTDPDPNTVPNVCSSAA